ncbi:MAG: hypothetical protein KDD22_03250, partial [Bdellovibrionales bacterium]|nr:hypothetical protein [Bdellovibrionales bacterium]
MRHWPKILPFLAIVVGVVTIFQNCAEPLEFAEQDAITMYNTLPFAYEEKVDTISYMSCSNIDPAVFQHRAIYSFRVGAYGPNSGLRLSQAFQDSTEKFAMAEKTQTLFESPLNRGATLQLSIRNTNDYRAKALINKGGQYIENFDFGNFLAPLDSAGLAQGLVAQPQGEYLSYFKGTPGLGTRFLEQSIRFIESERMAASVRDNLTGISTQPARLTLTYTEGPDAEPFLARAPSAEDPRHVFGTGFDIRFGYPQFRIPGANQTLQKPFRALTSVDEYDLLTGMRKPDAKWNCGNDNYTFLIVRPEDMKDLALNKQICLPAPDPDPSTLNRTQRK